MPHIIFIYFGDEADACSGHSSYLDQWGQLQCFNWGLDQLHLVGTLRSLVNSVGGPNLISSDKILRDNATRCSDAEVQPECGYVGAMPTDPEIALKQFTRTKRDLVGAKTKTPTDSVTFGQTNTHFSLRILTNPFTHFTATPSAKKARPLPRFLANPTPSPSTLWAGPSFTNYPIAKIRHQLHHRCRRCPKEDRPPVHRQTLAEVG